MQTNTTLQLYFWSGCASKLLAYCLIYQPLNQQHEKD